MPTGIYPRTKKKERVILTCLVCKKEFETFPYRKDTAKYCSKDCADNAPRSEETIDKMRKAQSLRPPVTEECRAKMSQASKGRVYRPDQYDTRRGLRKDTPTTYCKACGLELPNRSRRKYCSRKCQDTSFRTEEHFQKMSSLKTEWRKNNPLTELQKNNLIESRHKEPNSQETRDKMSLAKIGKPNYKIRGENSPNWRGGITEKNRGLRTALANTLEERTWKRCAMERDNFTCQDCKKRGGTLEVHHIKQFSIIREEYGFETLEEALLCDVLFDISNALTLCKNCHKIRTKEERKK